MAGDNTFLSKEEACERLGGISIDLLDKLMTRREIPYYKLGKPKQKGRSRVLFKKKDLDRWIEAFRVEEAI